MNRDHYCSFQLWWEAKGVENNTLNNFATWVDISFLTSFGILVGRQLGPMDLLPSNKVSFLKISLGLVGAIEKVCSLEMMLPM